MCIAFSDFSPSIIHIKFYNFFLSLPPKYHHRHHHAHSLLVLLSLCVLAPSLSLCFSTTSVNLLYYHMPTCRSTHPLPLFNAFDFPFCLEKFPWWLLKKFALALQCASSFFLSFSKCEKRTHHQRRRVVCLSVKHSFINIAHERTKAARGSLYSFTFYYYYY